MKRVSPQNPKPILLLKFPDTKRFKRNSDVSNNMAENHRRPLSNMDFIKPTKPSKYSLRQKKIERMSKNQIEAVIIRNEELEEENQTLKAEVESLKAKYEHGSVLVGSKDETFIVAETDVQVALEIVIAVADKEMQVSFSKENMDKGIQTDDIMEKIQVSMENFLGVEEEAEEVELDNVQFAQAIPEIVEKASFDFLPWLEIVSESDDFYFLEKKLIFDEALQTELVSTMAERIMAPDEETFMKYFIGRIFSRNFFVNVIGFNARAQKVQFKSTVLFRCFATSMMIKFQKSNENEEGEIEKYKIVIQDFMTDYKLLVKRNPNNWVH